MRDRDFSFRGWGFRGLRFGCLRVYGFRVRLRSSPFIIRVPFFLLFGFNKGTQTKKGQKATTREPGRGLGFAGLGVLRLWGFRA